MKNKPIKVVVRPRRAGKSFLSFQLVKDENFGYVNFDDEEITKVKDYDEILECVKEVYTLFY